MISKTEISKRNKRKRNPEIVETIQLAKKNGLMDLAKRLSSPRKNYSNVNLGDLEKIREDEILVIGKVLGSGEIKKKIRVAALSFSEQARKKLEKAGCEIKSIKNAIENDNKLNGIKVI